MNRFWLVLGIAGFLLGGVFGGWLSARFYGGQLESLRMQQARCSDAGKALESKLALQNVQVEALEQAARQRADSAERALTLAREQAQSHEAAASRLLLERSDGEECAAVRQLLDRALLP
ncbi:hypothetical protein N7414_20095 [Pseudomonas sp. GD04087]|uniref:hypothetical protein n=1 Tax=unclassified Pseudomonas TaxID=196821 RepID=UPI00244C7C04|nr:MULTISPECIES: hypothetical protein [unclassified Pseudomonas]MDH0291433.1 hypothetical protein [Pseudomonas sp. GD04087]MDH1051745.1 hypothetical protein [Pseudomonas sp. GD03903]MDH2001721.1 hypothetical protein [Pseudomonas sp. GD03691]